MPAGRPRIIESPEEMLKRGQRYFDECRANDSPILITGLALALGLSGREALGEYGRREEYSDTVKELKTVVESYAEARLYANNPTGAIFALKNFNWTDKQQQEISGPDGAPIQHEIKVEFVKTGDGNIDKSSVS